MESYRANYVNRANPQVAWAHMGHMTPDAYNLNYQATPSWYQSQGNWGSQVNGGWGNHWDPSWGKGYSNFGNCLSWDNGAIGGPVQQRQNSAFKGEEAQPALDQLVKFVADRVNFSDDMALRVISEGIEENNFGVYVKYSPSGAPILYVRGFPFCLRGSPETQWSETENQEVVVLSWRCSKCHDIITTKNYQLFGDTQKHRRRCES